MKKPIDIVDIKKALKNGELEIFTDKETNIYLGDVKTGEFIFIGNFKDLKRYERVNDDN